MSKKISVFDIFVLLCAGPVVLMVILSIEHVVSGRHESKRLEAKCCVMPWRDFGNLRDWMPPRTPFVMGFAEARAAARMHDVATGSGFTLRSVVCWRDGKYTACGLCFNHPSRLLGTAFVRCDEQSCEPVYDGDEERRGGWDGEAECRRDGP